MRLRRQASTRAHSSTSWNGRVTTSSAPSFRPRTRNGSAGVGFDVGYDLPNQGKEALITVGFTFEHESDGNTYTYSDTAKVKVAP